MNWRRPDAASLPHSMFEEIAMDETKESTQDNRPAIDRKLLEILVCPLTKGPLEYDARRQELISRSAKLAYPIRDGVPIMLPEEARPIEG
jgi:uncharacterized protein YbaR (Trm112 family)